MREYKITATVKHMDWDEPVTYIYKMNIEADTPNEARKYARDKVAERMKGEWYQAEYNIDNSLYEYHVNIYFTDDSCKICDITAKDRNESQEKINNLLHWLDTRECLRWSYYKWFNDEREV